MDAGESGNAVGSIGPGMEKAGRSLETMQIQRRKVCEDAAGFNKSLSVELCVSTL